MKSLSKILSVLASLSIFGACTKNDAQNDFERRAYQTAENITPTDFQGNITGNADVDDWQTSPLYSGLADINPIYPNPLPYGSENATLDIFLRDASFASILEVGYIDFQNRRVQLDFENSVSDFSSNILTINPESFGSNADIARGIYRLIIFDGNQRIISYGDLLIE